MSLQTPGGEEPEFISFLFSTLKHDFYFVVGNEDHMEPEKIGVVKAMLMAHSTVLRLQLEDSKLADKEQVAVPDIYPDTFRNLLRYVYGHDTTDSLNFNEADNLFYVSEKYMMSRLKNKLATKLMGLLNTENICSLLNNPAVYTELELNNAITKILRFETDKVLASPLFLDISCSGFVKILEQDGLNVPEIELWRAALKWAKHNADSEDGKQLRSQMSTITQHIRICTLTAEQFCQEVVPTQVLSKDEIKAVCLAIGKNEKQDELNEVSNEIIPRALVTKGHFNLMFTKHKGNISSCVKKEFTFGVVTKMFAIQLLPLKCLGYAKAQGTPAGATYPVECFITITRATDYTKPPVTVRFNKQVVYDTIFEIPLTSNGRNVTLLPNSEYNIWMEFDGDQRMYYNVTGYPGHYDNNHLTLNTMRSKMPDGCRSHFIPIDHLAYLTDAE